MKKYLVLLFICSHFIAIAQKTDSTEINKGKFFSNLYTGFYYKSSINDTISGFNMPTALFGYRRTINKKVTGTIIFDVTRTTNNVQVFDSTGSNLDVSYFEGSKYTAFLKMAEIKWEFIPKLSFSIGQLLNTQYLTFQDKFWAHRYVEVTFQELFRFGMPADFGARLNYEPSDKLKLSIDAHNGEGPFKYQDKNSDFIFSGNIEYKPIKELIVKFYYANHQPKQTDSLKMKQIFSSFLGFKSSKLTIAYEFDYVMSADFFNKDWYGFSAFAFYDFTEKLQAFYRFDYLIESKYETPTSYHIAGVQYKPTNTFFISANYRYFSFDKSNMVFINFGLKI